MQYVTDALLVNIDLHTSNKINFLFSYYCIYFFLYELDYRLLKYNLQWKAICKHAAHNIVIVFITDGKKVDHLKMVN